MLGKILVFLILLTITVILGWIVYENMPGEALPLTLTNNIGKNKLTTEEIIDYGETPMFDTNMRFPTNKITYYIEPTCTGRKEKMIEAFNTFERRTGILQFNREHYSTADILIGCSDDYIELGEDLYTAGEGGPSLIINTTKFRVIQKGKISLFKESECKEPVVELHELAHVLGFDHTQNPKSIMYPTADCEQEITEDMINTLQELYMIEPLPDLTITEADAITKGRYLDFNITVANEGLQPTTGDVILSISHNNEIFEEINMETLEIGYSRTLTAENIRMPTRNIENLTFSIDHKNTIREINELDNKIILN